MPLDFDWNNNNAKLITFLGQLIYILYVFE